MNTQASGKTYILARQDRIPVWLHSTSLSWILGAGSSLEEAGRKEG